MNRKGHVGMTLLAFAPIAYVLVSEGKPIFAALCWLGIQTVEPWPDQDFHLPGLTHRGVSHSLLAILVVGGVLGAVGWFLGDNLFDLLLAALLAGGDLFGWILNLLPDASANMINLLLPNVSLKAVVNHAHEIAGESMSRWTFAAYGLFVGAYGIFSHLLGDVITTRGIAPFLPFSRWRLSLSSLRADSPVANSSLFFLGVFAVVVAVVMTVPGVGLGLNAPTALSPVGVVSGQDAGSLVTENGSVAINETRTNRTRVVLDSVTLPRNGFIVAQVKNLSANESATKTEIIGHTQYVRHGTFDDVVLTLDEPIRGPTTVSVALYNDTNGNQTLDTGNAEADAPYRTTNGTPIRDTVKIGTNSSENATATSVNQSRASVGFQNQTTNGSTVTLKKVVLPKNGFVAIHTSEYTGGPAPAAYSVIAVSQHLPSGVHHNVTIDISHAPPNNPPGLNRTKLNHSQSLSAVVYRDSDDDHQFDFVSTYGENDSAFTKNGSVVHDSARVRVPEPEPQTASVIFRNQTLQNSTVVIEKARLPRGGFLVVLNESYQRTGDPLTSVVGSSRYLSPGNHTNVSIQLRPGAIGQTQVVTVMPSLDTNGDHRYDYVASSGFRDVAYETLNHSGIITDTALVRVPGSEQLTRTPGQTTTVSVTGTASTAPTATRAPSTAVSRGESESGLFDSLGITGIAAILVVVVVVLPTLLRKFS
ncbi:MAG TPA: metal-dependent hydrolase [Halococcus sp.]|nr:metal-dependent hydrolase [Halococcus sp.]